MKKLLLSLLLFSACFGAYAQCIINSQSKLQIVVPDDLQPKIGLERQFITVATTLQSAFQGALNLQVPIVKESQKATCQSIYLGDTQAIRAIGFKPAEYKNFDGVIAERNGDIYLAGHDHSRFDKTTMQWNSRDFILGTAKAAVVFMEDFMNVRFLMPGDAGLDIVPIKQIEVATGLTRQITPRLIFATGRHSTLCYDYANNNYGAGRFYSYGGHSYYQACPANVYGKDHPEYFAMKSGKRVSNQGHLCISNPDVQELIYKEALKRLDAGADVVQMAQTDGYQPCECDACKVYGNTTDEGEKIWILHRHLAERLLKDRPGKMLHLLCYPPNAKPPKTFTTFPDNVIIEMCRYTEEDFADWKNYTVKQGFTTYIYNWGWYQAVGITPKTSPRYCAQQATLFCSNNVRGIYRCGGGELPGLEGPCYYVYGKMFDNPSQDYNAITDEYYQRAFAQAYAPMRSFFETLYTRIEQMYLMPQHTSFKSPIRGGNLPKQRGITLGAIYSADLLCALEKHLAFAESMPLSDKIKARLALIRKEFDYVKNLGTCLAFYDVYQLAPSQETLKHLADKISERNALIDSYFDDKGKIITLKDFGVPLFGGITKPVLKVNGRLSAPISAPFTWDMEKIMARGILPGVGSKEMTIKKQTAITENLQSPAWDAAEWQPLSGIQLSETWCNARFKALHDGTAVYFALECNVRPNMTYKEFGKDGSCWNQDCLEIMLDVEAQHQRFYHFIINPLANSYFDARFGYITDPLHPSYNDSDSSWDGKWSYISTLNGTTWTAFVKIPFDTLKVKPVAGTRWYMNVGREAYTPKAADSKGRVDADIDLMLWSPNLESMSFIAPQSFGVVTFE